MSTGGSWLLDSWQGSVFPAGGDLPEARLCAVQVGGCTSARPSSPATPTPCFAGRQQPCQLVLPITPPPPSSSAPLPCSLMAVYCCQGPDEVTPFIPEEMPSPAPEAVVNVESIHQLQPGRVACVGSSS